MQLDYHKNNYWIEYYPIDKSYITANCASPDCFKERKHKLFFLRAMLKIGPFKLFPVFRDVEAYCTKCNHNLYLDEKRKSKILSEFRGNLMPNMKYYCKFYRLSSKNLKKRLIIQYLSSFPIGFLLSISPIGFLLSIIGSIFLTFLFLTFLFQPFSWFQPFSMSLDKLFIIFGLLMIYQTILFLYQYINIGSDNQLDMVKEFKTYYTATTNHQLVEFNEIQFLTIEGKSEPGGKEFTSKIDVLYSLAYSVKNLCKKQGKDFAVPKLEGLWWVESDKPWYEIPREKWHWKLLIRMPNFVTSKIIKSAKEDVFKKKGIDLIRYIKFEKINEGKCVQIMHIGPYSTEPETIKQMKSFMKENGFTENGFHHEIYISDPRKTDPKKMKTILRQPIKYIQKVMESK